MSICNLTPGRPLIQICDIGQTFSLCQANWPLSSSYLQGNDLEMTPGSSENPEVLFFFFSRVLVLKSEGHITIQWKVFNTSGFLEMEF